MKPVDKASKIIIMDKRQYLIEANRQLHNVAHYKPLSHILVRGIVEDLYRKKYISSKQRFCLVKILDIQENSICSQKSIRIRALGRFHSQFPRAGRLSPTMGVNPVESWSMWIVFEPLVPEA